MANTRDYGKFKKRRGFAEGGSVDGDDFYKAGERAYRNLFTDIAAPQTSAIADAKAEDSKAVAKGLSNIGDEL